MRSTSTSCEPFLWRIIQYYIPFKMVFICSNEKYDIMEGVEKLLDDHWLTLRLDHIVLVVWRQRVGQKSPGVANDETQLRVEKDIVVVL